MMCPKMKKAIITILLVLSVVLTGILIIRILYLYRYDPNWVTGQPLNWPNELLILTGVCAIPGIFLSIFKKIFKNNSLLMDWKFNALAVFLASSLYLFHVQPQKDLLTGHAGQWLYDPYVKVLVANRFAGPIIADEAYRLTIELENKTTVPLHITKIVVTYSSEKVAEIFSMKSDVTFKHENHIFHTLQPHEKKDISLSCNELLPEYAEIQIYHNYSAAPSKFYFNLESTLQPPPCPPALPASALIQETNSLDAMRRAQLKATKSDRKTNIFACFPGDSTKYIDTTTRLKYINTKSWVINFCSPDGKMYQTIVDKNEVNGGETDATCTWHPNPSPKISYQDALEIANRNHLICADWKDPRLLVGKLNNKFINVWYLPYRGRDSLPLIIDAQTGHLLKMIAVDGDLAIFEESKI